MTLIEALEKVGIIYKYQNGYYNGWNEDVDLTEYLKEAEKLMNNNASNN